MTGARAAWVRTALIVLAVLAADQITKALVRANVDPGSEDPILPAVKLVHVRNEGVAFGLKAGGTTLVFVVVALALLLLVLYFVRHSAKPLIWLPTGLLLGGAIGNVVDRIRQGAVTDFIKLPAWPAFNVADVAITFGVLALVYVLEGKDDGAADRPG